MKDKYVERRPLVEALLKDYPHCEACLIWASYDFIHGKIPSMFVRQNKTQDVHELVNRSQGGSILDRKNLFTICRSCHSRVTVHPKEAEIVGLHLESWCNTESGLAEAARVRAAWKDGTATEPYWIKE